MEVNIGKIEAIPPNCILFAPILTNFLLFVGTVGGPHIMMQKATPGSTAHNP